MAAGRTSLSFRFRLTIIFALLGLVGSGLSVVLILAEYTIRIPQSEQAAAAQLASQIAAAVEADLAEGQPIGVSARRFLVTYRPDGYFLAIYDVNGEPLSSIAYPISLKSEVSKGLQGKSSVGLYTAQDRSTGVVPLRQVVVTAPIKSKDAVVGVIQVVSSLWNNDNTAMSLLWRTLVASLAALLAIIGAGLYVGGSTASLLRQLQHAVTEMVEGNYHPSLPAPSHDEIGDVGQALQSLGQRLYDLRHFQTQFVSNVSHDLKNGLTGIDLAIQTLETTDMTSTQQRSMRDMRVSVERILRLVRDLALLAQLDEGRLQLHPELVELAELGTEAIDRHRSLADARGMHLSIVSELDGQEVWVHVDRDQMARVLDNLLDNALKYTPEGGTVCLQLLEPQNGYALLGVLDTGPGIPEEDRREGRIFQRFYRGTTDRKEGSGLGLAIVQELASEHGGTVEVESRLGRGTTFILKLPLAAE